MVIGYIIQIKINGMENICDYLSIVVVTYNRAILLDRTINSILRSPFKLCPITILNNHSTDETISIAYNHSRNNNNVNVITNLFNIGGDANILRAVEYATTKYIWILADDDTYDFSDCNDVIDKLCNGNVDLLHVGGHKELERPLCSCSCPKDAVNNGYPFFKTCSFIPANIFKVQLIQDSLIDGYRNIKNSYAHMPLFIKLYDNDCSFYISKNKIVLAEIGAQNYTHNDLLEWWINTAYTYILNNNLRLKFIYSQFFNTQSNFKYIRLLSMLLDRNVSILILFQVLLMKNFIVSIFSLICAIFWRTISKIKNNLLCSCL